MSSRLVVSGVQCLTQDAWWSCSVRMVFITGPSVRRTRGKVPVSGGFSQSLPLGGPESGQVPALPCERCLNQSLRMMAKPTQASLVLVVRPSLPAHAGAFSCPVPGSLQSITGPQSSSLQVLISVNCRSGDLGSSFGFIISCLAFDMSLKIPGLTFLISKMKS